MKIAVIGASGFVGAAILKEAVERHHSVTAICRSPEKVPALPGVIAVKGDVSDVQGLSELLAGHDVIISAFNAGWTNPELYNDFLIGSRNIQLAIKSAGLKRYIVIGGAGSLYIEPGKQLVDTPDFPAAFRSGALAARDYLNELTNETELDWTFFSPAIEMHPGTSGIRRGTFRLGNDTPVFDKDGRSILSVEDLAVAILDEAEKPVHVRKRFTAAY